MKNPNLRLFSLRFLAVTAAVALAGCKSNDFAEEVPPTDLTSEDPFPSLDTDDENPNKSLPMDFTAASQSVRDSKSFPGGFRVAADAIELGRATSSPIPNIGAQGDAYLEMPHPDGTPLNVRGNRILSHNGTVTVSGWPVVVRQGKRLVGTTKDTVIKIGSDGVQALGPSVVEDLVASASDTPADLLTPLPSLSASDPFIPLPADFDLPEPSGSAPETPTAPEPAQRRGIIDGKPLARTQKRGFTGSYEGTENPNMPGDPASNKKNPSSGGIDLSPAAASTDLGIGNLPPLPTIPGE